MSEPFVVPGTDPPIRWSSCIHWRRRRAGWSEAALAARAGLSADTVAAFEREQTEPTVSQFIALARALGCLVDDLIDVRDQGEAERLIWRCGDTVVTYYASEEKEE